MNTADKKPAEAVKNHHPERALEIWKGIAESEIAQTKVKAYQESSKYLKKIQRLLKQNKNERNWQDYVGQLRQANARKPRFIEITIAPDTPETDDTHIESSEDRTIKGKTTFEDVMNWGVSKEEIETAIGRSISAPGDKIKDLAEAQGIEFSEWKTPLQKLIDSKN